MTTPFEIGEIFPEEAAGPVRLPRRQAGSSPQGLAVTVLADYTLRTRAWLPSAALVALLAESGVSHAGARAAVSRLARRGALEGRRQGRHSWYRLTDGTAAGLSAGGRWVVASMTDPPAWDGLWTLVAFSLPKDLDVQRRALRGQLRWLGYAPLYDGLWLSPHDVTHTTTDQLARLTQGTVTVFRARHVDLAATVGRAPLDAWDIGAIAGHYAEFVRRWNALLPRIRSGGLGGADAVRARTEVMDTYRRFPVLDPQLPLDLLPPGWLRAPAAEVFAAVYDGLAEPAQAHVRSVAARFGDDGTAGVAAHSVAELLAGVRGPVSRCPG
ncbi:PaaX family transcriptional regulator C-terminal domain-containing protein [Actinoplanes sp. N902-109]|uniref:PaaX family transcriptional regulator n=1 Tax=Actinoplanes sp. (strain N902-109) TaxID=649831 RepID=UPI0003293602|nr:PaaX family transcriptional regulator C-terminal domain-containing protein [Actinoplanes sp. N902-109]AGL16690.1 PaaX family transcriptional regulator [Actinoplanes sp. N902-109]